MTQKVRLGIIGHGAEGTMYSKFLTEGHVPEMEIGAICDILPEKKEAADSYGVPFFTDYIDMLDSGTIDAIVTCVPHYLHPEMGIEALKRKIHTLIEKPVGVYTKQAREVIEFAQNTPDVKCGVFFNQRTNPLYRGFESIDRFWRTRFPAPHLVDHHHLVASPGLLQPVRMASNMGWRRGRRSRQPGTTPA
ncbi:Gfo/Idh/MocA family protein [Arcanobacterium canis]